MAHLITTISKLFLKSTVFKSRPPRRYSVVVSPPHFADSTIVSRCKSSCHFVHKIFIILRTTGYLLHHICKSLAICSIILLRCPATNSAADDLPCHNAHVLPTPALNLPTILAIDVEGQCPILHRPV